MNRGRGRAIAFVCAGLLGLVGCQAAEPAASARPTPGTARATATPSHPPGARVTPSAVRNQPAVLVGAGDIAACDSDGDEQTAALLDHIPGTVFTLGDNAYPDGSATDFAQCYGPTWGRHKARTRPVLGNHEYHTEKAAGYFGYFGAAAGDNARGYYSYDVGGWHVVVLNSTCAAIDEGCRAGSPEERWLRADLTANGKRCTVAMWHHPIFTSGRTHGPAPATLPLFQALYDGGVEVLLTAHNHQYERFAPQTPAGLRDDARGVREFVVGTGGAFHYAFGPQAPNSEVRNADTFGVLQLTLHARSYDWRFVPAAGGSFTDSGRASCH
jgi:hypothetical protein